MTVTKNGWQPFRTLLLATSLVVIVTGCATPFDVQGHRGARGLAPENTLPAFAKAMDLGVTTLELDIGITADDVVVIAHDPKLNPNLMRNAQGEYVGTSTPTLRSLRYEEIARYDVGRLKPDSNYAKQFPHQVAMDRTPIPRLQDLFALVKARGDSKTRFNIETKIRPDAPNDTADAQTFVRLLIDVIRQEGMLSRVSIQSFDWRTLQLVQQQTPAIPTVYLSIQQPTFNTITGSNALSWTAGLSLAADGSVPALVKRAGGAVWSPHYKDLTPDSLKQATQLGLKVIPWTINDAKDMQALMDMGVHGIITDRPDLLIKLRATR